MKSFEVYGISMVTDGSEDADIRCLKLLEVEAEMELRIAWPISELQSRTIL